MSSTKSTGDHSLRAAPERRRNTRNNLAKDLRNELVKHIAELKLDALMAENLSGDVRKAMIRSSHAHQRSDLLDREKRALGPHVSRLIGYFADGVEVQPELIDPVLVPVLSGEETALLFRLATTLWSVPVSKGYGRRIRFLVMDRQNERLIGVIAIGDPVFNLRVRDDWIGWTVGRRKLRLVNVMDAYVLGAVPPYSQMLGGKLVCALLGSKEVSDFFETKYASSTGIISNKKRGPKLALVTVTSALGRSSLYNRVALPNLGRLHRVGVTEGWGHFHVPDALFRKMRELLELDQHPYADGHQFGEGPNWRIRVIRECLSRIGMDPNILRHGISREVYAMPLADNWQDFLRGKSKTCVMNRPTVSDLARSAVERWVIQRANRRPEYVDWTRDEIRQLLRPLLNEDPPSPSPPQDLMREALHSTR